jgi:transposase-like protein
MPCPHCSSEETRELDRPTKLGYKRYQCASCDRTFNERTGTPFNHLEFPTDLVLLVVLWRLRYKLTLRDLAEMFLERGLVFTHEAVRDWEARFAPLMAEELRKRRKGNRGRKWHVDETYLKVKGKWCYLYRAIDKEGKLIDVRLSKTRDMEAAKQFFEKALTTAGDVPEKVTTDGHDSYPRAIEETLGEEVEHRSSRYMNNVMEQDHRGIKGRYKIMHCFKGFDSASRFCDAYDGLRDYLRPRSCRYETLSLPEQRNLYLERTQSLLAAVGGV